MATVTGYTAARIQAIEDEAIVSGQVVGDNLILTKNNNTTINAGNVRGPQGDTGPAGQVSTLTLQAEVQDLETHIRNQGKGVIARTEYAGADQPVTLNAVYQPLNGASLPFTPSPGRLYRLTGSCAFVGSAPSQATVQLIAGTDLLGAQGFYIGSSNYTYFAYIDRIFLAPAGWNVQKTLTLQIHSVTTTTVKSTGDEARKIRLAVEDLGVPGGAGL